MRGFIPNFSEFGLKAGEKTLREEDEVFLEGMKKEERFWRTGS